MLEHQVDTLRSQIVQHEETRHELEQFQAKVAEKTQEHKQLETVCQEELAAKDEAQQIQRDQHQTELSERHKERKRLEADFESKLQKQLEANDEAHKNLTGTFQVELAEQANNLRAEMRNELAAKDETHRALKNQLQSELADNVAAQKSLEVKICAELAGMEGTQESLKNNASETYDRELHLTAVSERWQAKSEKLEMWASELKEELHRCGDIKEQRAALQKDAEELLLLRQQANKFWAEATLERKKAEQLKNEVYQEREERQQEKNAWGKQEQRNTRKRMEAELVRSLAAIRNADSNFFPSSAV